MLTASISREGFSRLQLTYITLQAGKQLIDFMAHLVNRIHCAAYISHHRWESQQHTSGALKSNPRDQQTSTFSFSSELPDSDIYLSTDDTASTYVQRCNSVPARLDHSVSRSGHDNVRLAGRHSSPGLVNRRSTSSSPWGHDMWSRRFADALCLELLSHTPESARPGARVIAGPISSAASPPSWMGEDCLAERMRLVWNSRHSSSSNDSFQSSSGDS